MYTQHLLVAAGAVATIMVVLFLKSRAGMSLGHMTELMQGFLRLEKRAFRNIGRSSAPNATRLPSLEELMRGAVRTSKGFSLAYTIDMEDSSFNHVISGQAPRRSQKFVVQGMLTIMVELTRQFEEAGLTGQTQIQIGESETGTQYLGFVLTEEQNEALRKVAQATRIPA